MTDPIGSFARSWRLMRASFDVLRSDGELLILPAISGVATAILAGGFVWQLMASDAFAPTPDNGVTLSLSLYASLFAFYLVQYFIVIFFNTALVGAALARLSGARPNCRLGARRSPCSGSCRSSATRSSRRRSASCCACFAERIGILGRLIAAGAGLAWTVATFLVVPVLAAEGLGPIAAIEKSTALLRKTWGENIVGTAGISILLSAAGGIAGLGVGGGVFLITVGNVAAGIPVIAGCVVLLLTIVLFGAALTGIYSAAVYYYAALGEPPEGFDGDIIRGAFAAKGSG